ncbi:hypothetical protein AB0G71_22760 [Streptomyces sp. NPDC020403]|uniref:hypothetical protein n=1 Tax=unclassified Streptomyces TaxID=2593676 RepID=UPI0033D71066
MRLDRQAGGYLLTVDPGPVDLHRFRDLIARARAATDEVAAALIVASGRDLHSATASALNCGG